MMANQNGFTAGIASEDAGAPGEDGAPSPDATVQAALASLAAHGNNPSAPRLGEMKYRLTVLLFPAILLLFVALYVTCLTTGVEPEVALFRAGGVAVVLAVLGRVAVGILGDDTRLVLNDNQIVAMARNGAVRDYLAGAQAERSPDGAEQSLTAAQMAGAGGKE